MRVINPAMTFLFKACSRLRTLSTIIDAPREVVVRFFANDCPYMAAAITYYALFSTFPLLLGMTALFGAVMGPAQVEDRLVGMLATYAPLSRDFIAATLRGVAEAAPALGAVAVLGLFWAGADVFSALGHSIDRVWGSPPRRPLVIQKLLELAMAASVGLLFLVSLGFTLLFALPQASIIALPMPLGTLGQSLGEVAQALLLLFIAFLIFLALYRVLPSESPGWGPLVLGAMVGSALFEIAKRASFAFGLAFGGLNVVYGSLTAAIIFLLWIYFSANIVLFGAQVAIVAAGRVKKAVPPEAGGRS